jgi:hypothetical protein
MRITQDLHKIVQEHTDHVKAGVVAPKLDAPAEVPQGIGA